MEGTDSFKEVLRMNYGSFLNLLTIIEQDISLQESYHGVVTIKAVERLTLTLRFLAGETFRSLDFQFQISCSAISYIIMSVCEALISRPLTAEARALPYCLEKLPFVMVGNDAFALNNYMMEPFPQKLNA